MKYIFLTIALLIIAAIITYFYGRFLWAPAARQFEGVRTVATVVSFYGEAARERLEPYFKSAGLNYPPAKVSFLGIKNNATLELWAEAEPESSEPVFIRSYPIQALSGVAGPKQREGDGQVPEGLYNIEGLNPNSSYHLSMKLNYPNAFDLKHAAAEGRHEPGTNIFIHGKAVSIGCLAMGDSVIEELFVLAADIGRENIQVAIAPSDPRVNLLSAEGKPGWVAELYEKLNNWFARYKK